MLEKTPTEAAFHAMIRTGVLVRRLAEPYFARHGISGSQWGVLRALQRAEAEGLDGIRVTDLGGRLLIRTPSVTGVVGRLERAGLVGREVSADDHRARLLRLTPAGRRLVHRLRDGHARRVEAFLAPLDEGQRAELARLLDQVSDHLQELADVGEPHDVAASGD